MFFMKKKNLEKIRVSFKECFEEIPRTGFENQSYKWFSTDIEERNFPVDYSERISYEFNSQGYRCNEFTRKAFNIMTLGCSMTFGNAVPVHDRFSTLICNELGKDVADWNLAWPGTSGDYCSRIIALCFDRLKPDLVLVNFPHIGRMEYFDCNGRLYDYRPLAKTTDLIEKQNKELIDGLASEYQSIYRFFKNFKLIEKTIQSTPWLFSVQKEDEQTLKQYTDNELFVKPLNKVDTGRDGGHPGIKSHSLHAESYLRKIKEVYGDKLPKILNV